MKPILLFGAQGQLGRALAARLAQDPPSGLPAFTLETFNRTHCDLRSATRLGALIRERQPWAIINAAAFTAVDLAQAKPDLAHAINAHAVAAMAAAAASSGAWMVHFSTDYVFDGAQPAAYRETDTAAPLSVYGRSKLAGEQAVIASGCRHLVFRTSWLYSAGPGNFLGTILRRLRQHPEDSLNVVADVHGTPNSARRIASAALDALALCLQPTPAAAGGRYHLSASGRTSWYDYASFAARQASALGLLPAGSAARIHPIAASAWKAPAPRPPQSQLDNTRFQQAFGLLLPDWRNDLSQTLEQIAREPDWLTSPP